MVRASLIRLASPLVAAALALSATPAAAQAPSWTAADRQAAIGALRKAGGTVADDIGDPALDAAMVRYATTELGQRINPTEVDKLWAIAPERRDVAAELDAARAKGAFQAWLGALSPPFPEYRTLRAAEARYQMTAEAGGWAKLPPGPVLRRGDHNAQVALLRTRLAAEGYASAAGGDPETFDATLQSALIAFQSRHALFNDGVLKAETRAALNVTAEDRAAQIEANLERWRWLPHALPADRFEVDIAGATGQLIQGGKPVLQMRVVVGQPTKQTPSFSSKLESVVLNPPWNVPASIAEAEILPKAAKDPDYLARNDYVMVDGHLQQKPGPKDALGQIKFDLPSPFGVYLHDTPAKSAFARQARALSHGCMRLEKPRDLANILLGAQGWSSEAIGAAIATGKTQVAPLKTRVPLYVLYWTAVADEKGQVDFRPDVYGWDRKLIEALGGLQALLADAGPATDCAGGS
jgi:murein L,D-transpeptidase YcbB/YkuD